MGTLQLKEELYIIIFLLMGHWVTKGRLLLLELHELQNKLHRGQDEAR